MTPLMWSIVIGAAIIVALSVAVVIGKFLALRNLQFPTVLDSKPRPCYRCGVDSNSDYMGLRYCSMCQMVVSRMMSVVRNDPPFGFPGAPGYTEHSLKDEEKKEAKNG